MADHPGYKLVKAFPGGMQLTYDRDVLASIGDAVWRRMGRPIDHPTKLLDRVVLAHLDQEDERYALMRELTKQRFIERFPRGTYKKVADKVEEQLEALIDEELAEEGKFFDTMTRTADGQVTLVGLGRWAQSAYPTIQLPHTYAASLMATNISKDIADDLQMPWPGMMIECPVGLLELGTADGQMLPIERILVTRMPNTAIKGIGWAYVAWTNTTLTFWRFGCKTEDMLGIGDWETHKWANPDLNPFAYPITDRDERLGNLLGRLILNVCLAMSDPANVKPIGQGHKAHEQAARRRQPGPPVVRTFQVGRPLVKHDCRPLIAGYLRGDREYREVTVQTFVCGHWKRQPYGEGLALRKTIWIEPYWRGPEDAPIVTRPHVLGKQPIEKGP